MVHMLVGLMVCFVEFILQLIVCLIVVVVVTERWMQKIMFQIKVRFCNVEIVLLGKLLIVISKMTQSSPGKPSCLVKSFKLAEEVLFLVTQ